MGRREGGRGVGEDNPWIVNQPFESFLQANRLAIIQQSKDGKSKRAMHVSVLCCVFNIALTLSINLISFGGYNVNNRFRRVHVE